MQIIFPKDFPSTLSQIHKPPQKLYFKGDTSLLSTPAIAIVGTRRIDPYAKYVTEKIVAELSNYNITIISGLADGVDAVAHEAALKNNLKTIAVLGSGLNKIWPSKNIPLANRIAKEGLLISEFEPEQRPTQFTFPQRNRIVSALSLATLVVQAPESSGALITAKYALEQNKLIFTIPADIDRQNFRGNLHLLQKSAAYPISSAKEIISELNLIQRNEMVQTNIEINLTAAQKRLLKYMSPSRGVSVEDLSAVTKKTISETLIQLSLLEIRGFVTMKSGNYFRIHA